MNALPKSGPRVCVVGAGVIGLSTAVRILEDSQTWPGMSGVEVTVVADRFTPHTTSDGSGGFWEPFRLGDTPPSVIRQWSDVTWYHLRQLALSARLAGTVGAQFVSGYHLSDSPTTEEPSFKDQVLGFRHLTPAEMSLFPAARSGYFMTTLQISVPKYLTWLLQRFKSAGGKTEFKTVDNLSQVAESYDLIVNCAGVRGAQLTSDPDVVPIRGQVRRVHAPWIKHFFIFTPQDGEPTYLLPQGEEVVVGGVAQRHNWKEEVDEEDSEDIWTRAVSIFPFLQGGRTLREWAGLRPGRSVARVARDDVTTAGGRSVPVVHNYGHGGSGVTVHWGCAADAVRLVRPALLHPPPPPHSKL